jgi:hypothetical protein
MSLGRSDTCGGILSDGVGTGLGPIVSISGFPMIFSSFCRFICDVFWFSRIAEVFLYLRSDGASSTHFQIYAPGIRVGLVILLAFLFHLSLHVQ